MGLYDKIRQDSKLDNRRAAKSIFCEILRGQKDIAFLANNGLIPSFLHIDTRTGIDVRHRKCFAMPVAKYAELKKLTEAAGEQIKSILDEQNKDTFTDTDAYSIILGAEEKTLRFIKQNMVLVQLDEEMPQGKLAGLDPAFFGVLVDTIDVAGCVNGRYARKTVNSVYKVPKLTDNP
jgi:hypothetical protein